MLELNEPDEPAAESAELPITGWLLVYLVPAAPTTVKLTLLSGMILHDFAISTILYTSLFTIDLLGSC